MAQSLTSKDEAAVMKRQIVDLVDSLERQGFGRGTIGAAMAGIGLALTQVHCGHDEAAQIVAGLKNILESDVSEKH